MFLVLGIETEKKEVFNKLRNYFLLIVRLHINYSKLYLTLASPQVSQSPSTPMSQSPAPKSRATVTIGGQCVLLQNSL